MPVKSTPEPRLLLKRLQADYPRLIFVASSRFSWHAGRQHISYTDASLEDIRGIWAILHELGHALLGHIDYASDVELVNIEVAAWDRARTLAATYGLAIDEDYIQDSLDSYRDWLHVRSTCPMCYEHCIQATKEVYQCHNCRSTWHVTESRLCRPYRKTQKKDLV